MNYSLHKTKKGFSLTKVKCKMPVHHKHHTKKVKVQPNKKDIGTLFFVKLPETMGSAVGDVAIGEFIKKKR